MKTINLTRLLILFLSMSFGITQAQVPTLTPLEVVNKRMDAYNQHDFGEFIKLYADDVKIYTYPDIVLGTGIDHLSWIFKPKFESKSMQVEIISQMSNGDHVINHEVVTENGIEKKYISIYEVKDGLISSVRFVRGDNP